MHAKKPSLPGSAKQAVNGLQDLLLADVIARWSSDKQAEPEIEDNKRPLERVRLIRRVKPLDKNPSTPMTS
jgi:hypothetical protein